MSSKKKNHKSKKKNHKNKLLFLFLFFLVLIIWVFFIFREKITTFSNNTIKPKVVEVIDEVIWPNIVYIVDDVIRPSIHNISEDLIKPLTSNISDKFSDFKTIWFLNSIFTSESFKKESETIEKQEGLIKEEVVHISEEDIIDANKILEKWVLSKDNCKIILNFDKSLIKNKKNILNEKEFDKFNKKCDYKYNISESVLNKNFCVRLINLKKDEIEKKYIIFNNVENIKDKCEAKFSNLDLKSSELILLSNKSIILESKWPDLLFPWEETIIWVNLLNNSSETIWFKLEFDSDDIDIEDNIKNIFISWWESKLITWDIITPYNTFDLKYKISAFWKSKDNNDFIENSIKIKTPIWTIIKELKWLIVPEFEEKAWISEAHFELSDDIDIKNSKVKIIISNNNLSWINNILSDNDQSNFEIAEDLIWNILSKVLLLDLNKIYTYNNINTEETLKELENLIEELSLIQSEQGSFNYLNPENYQNSLNFNSLLLLDLLEIQNYYSSDLLNEVINKNINYIESEYKDAIDNNFLLFNELDVVLALWKGGKKDYLDLEFDRSILENLLKYTYIQYYSNKKLDDTEVIENIISIKKLLNDKKNISYDKDIYQKSLFFNLLLDFWYDSLYLDNLNTELNSKMFTKYYNSLRTRNLAFSWFLKYIKNNLNNEEIRFWFSLWKVLNREEIFFLWNQEGNVKKFEYSLEDVLFYTDRKFDFRIANLSQWWLFADVIVEYYKKVYLEE